MMLKIIYDWPMKSKLVSFNPCLIVFLNFFHIKFLILFFDGYIKFLILRFISLKNFSPCFTYLILFQKICIKKQGKNS